MALALEKCRRCQAEEPGYVQVLQEIAYSEGKSVRDLLQRIERSPRSCLAEKAAQVAAERQSHREEATQECQKNLQLRDEMLALEAVDKVVYGLDPEVIAERLANDELRQRLEAQLASLESPAAQAVEVVDLQEALREHIDRGDIELDGELLRITSRGAQKLASHVLRRVLAALAPGQSGPLLAAKAGWGTSFSPASRQYDFGDDYASVDFQETLLRSLRRQPAQDGHIQLQPEDFLVHERLGSTRTCAGLIIDESRSMAGEKANAAIAASLALAGLILHEPSAELKVLLFSDRVKEIAFWEIANARFLGGTTDIAKALATYRKVVQGRKGDKQAYLITDVESNTENGVYVGFSSAVAGVMSEAIRYRGEGITLNIVMLDRNPPLVELARALAVKNSGRVFFATPDTLAQVVVEDYLRTRKRARRAL